MYIPFLSKKIKNNQSHYFGIFLKEEEGIGLILKLENGKMNIIEEEHFIYSNGWENIVQDIDEVLFKFEKKRNITIEETIFFVYSHFIDEKQNDIKKPYLQKIKEIVKSLELKPLGYIECSEAVLAFLQKKEEMPLTAIVVELDKTNVGVIVYKGGKVSHSKILARTNNLVDDLILAFQELKGKFLLPARIILYNSKDLDDESTKIISYHWDEDYFMQIPRVEILKEEEILNGLSKIFEDQMLKNANQSEVIKEEKKEVMGFVIGGDVGLSEQKKYEERSRFTLPIIPDLKSLISNFKSKFIISRSNVLSKRPKILWVFVGFLIICIALTLNEIFLHSASLTVFLPTQDVQKNLHIVGSLNEESKDSLKIIIATTSSNFKESIPTTGKRDIGDKSKGSITLHSFDDKEKTFIKGTLIESNGIQYSLDDDVKIASSSLTTDGSAKLPGKGVVKITAVNIGTESNLDKGQRFKIENLSSTLYFGINEGVLTGGSKKQVRTVAKKDVDDLKTLILEKSKAKPNSKLNNSNLSEEIIPQLSKAELRDLRYSKEVGEESAEVTLQTTVDNTYFYIRKDDLNNYLSLILQKEIKDGYGFEKGKIRYEINEVKKESNNNINISISISVKALKKISEKTIRKAIALKTKSQVDTILKQTYGVEGYELQIKNPIPYLNSITPFILEKIHLTISNL